VEWVRPHSSTIFSEFSKCSSVSVGKPAMMSAPKAASGRMRRTSSQNGSCPRGQVAALHPLQDHVVAMLQRKMKMRHQPLFGGNRLHQVVVGLDGIDGGQAQRSSSAPAQDLAHQLAERRRAGQVGAVAGQSTPVSTTSL
jgi:hypothetical protein